MFNTIMRGPNSIDYFIKHLFLILIFVSEMFVYWKPYTINSVWGVPTMNMVLKVIHWYYSYLDSSGFALWIQIAVIAKTMYNIRIIYADNFI